VDHRGGLAGNGHLADGAEAEGVDEIRDF
jgi:hypothetical protein